MSTLRGRSHVGSDGILRIPVSDVSANSDVEYTIEYHAARSGTTSRISPLTPARVTGQARRELLERVAGSIDDSTFERPVQGEYEARERLD